MEQNNSEKLSIEYTELNDWWGLWNSEKETILEYCSYSDNILDIGCGAGRVCIGMHDLGYKNITAIDIDENMISQAKLKTPSGYRINYLCGDITDIRLNTLFNVAIFSYNGIMSIIGSENRKKAFDNIYAHLEDGGKFIFTTHLGISDSMSQYLPFWQERRYQYKLNNKEIDDEFFTLQVEDKGVPILQFFAYDTDILKDLNSSGFDLIHTFRRDDCFIEKDIITNNTNNCRFWICKKIKK